MSECVPFIGREEELALVENLIKKWGTCKLVLLQGEGGIGKTRLLQEMRARFAGMGDPPVLMPEIIDFSRPEIRAAEGLRLAIAEAVGRTAFTAYLRSLADWRKVRQAGASPERLEKETQSVIASFAESFNAVSSQRQVVLLIDTVDTVTEQDITNIGFVSYLENALLLLAGRKVEDLKKMFPSRVGSDVQVMRLSPFQPQDSAQYLQEKQKMLHTTLGKHLAAKLLLLAAGRPIIIDLAVEWVAHEAPGDWLVDWLQDESLDELLGLSEGELKEQLSEDELKKRCRDFEYHLVHPIARRRTSLDQLFLVLAKVDSLDVDGVAQMLGLSSEEAGALWNKAREFSVVKLLSGEEIALHDEMRRMVNEYVWPEIDPTGARLRRDNQRAAAYFAGQFADLRSRLEEVKRKEENAKARGLTDQELDASWQREALERKLWVSARQQLSFTNAVEPSEGADLFVQLFDYATRSYNFPVRQELIDETEPYSRQFSFKQKFKYDIRRAKHLHDQGDYLGEKALLLELLRAEDLELEPDQQIEAWIQLGNAEVRMGDFTAGIAHFGEAIQISQQHELTSQCAKAETALGWGCRLIGQLDEATKHYRSALRAAFDTDDKWSQALLLTNLGYMYALRRNRGAALQLCHQALELWEQLDYERGIGTVYGTVATILLEFGQFEEALSYRQRALNIFEPMRDLERLSTNYYLRGVNRWLLRDLDAARKDLERAQEIEMEYEQHIILHYLAHVYKDQGDIEKALELFERSYKVSQSLPDPLYELSNLGGQVEIARYQQQFARWREFENDAISYKDQWSMVQYDLPEGLLWKYLGDLALGDAQLDKAIEFYQQGLPLVAKAGTYEPYTISTQLRETERLFGEQPACLRDLGKALMQFWLDEKLDQAHPETLFFFARWQHQEQPEAAQ